MIDDEYAKTMDFYKYELEEKYKNLFKEISKEL
jgi:hypothetical protein